jgi:hypothetical protein
MNGRRYRLASDWVGTQARSTSISLSIEARNTSSGRCGIDIRSAERWNRRAFSSARNSANPPSAQWYAFSPSKISCA